MHCTQNIIPNGIFHRNRNIPNNILQQLRSLNSQKDSEKEEGTWRHLPLCLQTISRSCNNHNSEELAQTQAQGLEEKIESTDKEIKENTNKQKNIPCSCTGRMSY